MPGDIYDCTLPLERFEPGDDVRKRIKAKIDLWAFLNESVEDLLKSYEDKGELTLEIIGSTIWQLHPLYQGEELLIEVELVLNTLKLEIPDDYDKMYADTLQRIVLKKIKGLEQNKRRNKK